MSNIFKEISYWKIMLQFLNTSIFSLHSYTRDQYVEYNKRFTYYYTYFN